MAKQAPKPDPKDPKTVEKKDENDPNAKTEPEQLQPAADTVKVKFLRSHPALAYSPGEVADLPRELYDKYLEAGPFYEAIVSEPTE